MQNDCVMLLNYIICYNSTFWIFNVSHFWISLCVLFWFHESLSQRDNQHLFYFGSLTARIRVICLCPQREDEVALHEWSVWTDAEDLQWVCETTSLQWGVPVHESPSALEHRWATSEATDAWSTYMPENQTYSLELNKQISFYRGQ